MKISGIRALRMAIIGFARAIAGERPRYFNLASAIGNDVGAEALVASGRLDVETIRIIPGNAHNTKN